MIAICHLLAMVLNAGRIMLFSIHYINWQLQMSGIPNDVAIYYVQELSMNQEKTDCCMVFV